MCCSSLLNTPSSTPVSAVPFDSAIPSGAAGERGHRRAGHENSCRRKDPGAGISWERAARLPGELKELIEALVTGPKIPGCTSEAEAVWLTFLKG